MDVFIGRQPIFNNNEEIVAYELLYRKNERNHFLNATDSDTATADVLINSFLTFGMEEVTRGRIGFINFTENILNSPMIEFINPDKVVIEILEDVPITPKLIERIRELKQQGFTIALDDFILNEEVKIYDQLFELTDIIKIDFLLTPLLERMEIENKIKSEYSHIQLLAEKVETRNHYDVAVNSGYSLFQGYFFEKPQIIKSTDIPINTLQYFQILSLLKDDEPDIDMLAEMIERDISLSYKLLQIINKSGSGIRRKFKVRSIKQAIMILGLTELKKFMYLLALREGGIEKTDTFKQLMYSSLFRAKVCEGLAKLKGEENYSEYFLIGMFSLIDTLLKRPKKFIIGQLPFSEEVRDTIIGNDTNMLPYLQFSIAISKLNWNIVDNYCEQFHIDKSVIRYLYEEADQWAMNAIFEI